MSWLANNTEKHDTNHIQPPTLTTTPTPLTLSATSPANAKSNATAIHVSTSQLTQTIHIHTFQISPASGLRWAPSRHIELQLPPDLDLISGRAALDDERRRLELTPCRYSHIPSSGSDISDSDDANVAATDIEVGSNGIVEVQFVTRTGTITSQIGLPRFRALEASILGCGGGFPSRAHGSVDSGTLDVNSAARMSVAVAVAGGVGICAFLATDTGAHRGAVQYRQEAKENKEGKESMKLSVLLWTLHVDDWRFVHYAIEKRLLVVDSWSRIHVFLTSGTEKIATGQEERITQSISKLLSANERLLFHFRRIQLDDLSEAIESKITVAQRKVPQTSTILFCGRKALEWQIKFWARSMKPSVAVYTTKMQK